ncbi:MarR family winged helix-turn-helix transcriptional regulator [Nocardiopsis ansamitocini]|uniref:Transcriptional regulator n=1 Tax=Nocardiopsis ansamitocini TaxID=1670832 RepID=A0A9W6P5R8_9ACTN|nr:MarR family winged helix-turn-helix transcriptional regulator [Nocardiopsis ansamitocini]GLU47574.1 transcriptional regulator [Nocardiopsis ansamitocini]
MERPGGDFAEFSQAWGDLMGAVVRARGRGTALTEPELTLSQALLLEVIGGLEHPTVGEIANAAGIASPSATRMLQQLERKGMVSRRRSDRDERSTVITVTEAGSRALTEHLDHVRDRQHAIFTAVDPRLRPALVELLRGMRDVVNDM